MAPPSTPPPSSLSIGTASPLALIPPELPPLTPDRLSAAAAAFRNSAGGLDGWRPEEAKCLPPAFWEQACTLLTAIEDGDPLALFYP